MDPHVNNQLIWDRGGKAIQERQDRWCWSDRTAVGQKKRNVILSLNLILYAKSNFTWMMDLNIKCKSTQLLEKNGRKIFGM